MSIRTMVAQPLEATPRSNSYVTIQMRRGLESQMDKSKFLPAEFGATTDTKKLFFAFGAGDVQQLATYQNLEGLMAQALAGLEEEYLGSITQATQNAINATSQASSAATAANQAADEANEIIDAFKEAVDGTVISDSSPSSSTAYSSQKIENVFLKKTGNGSNVTVTFQQAAERAGIQPGDSLAVAFGKLAKFCADIQDYVFSPPVASLASTDATRPLAASMGKRLNDDFTAKYNSLNSALGFYNQKFSTAWLTFQTDILNIEKDIGYHAISHLLMLNGTGILKLDGNFINKAYQIEAYNSIVFGINIDLINSMFGQNFTTIYGGMWNIQPEDNSNISVPFSYDKGTTVEFYNLVHPAATLSRVYTVDGATGAWGIGSVPPGRLTMEIYLA